MEEIKSSLSIPVSVKLSPFYTNPLYAISHMDSAGVDGFVLFNKLFQPDINIEKEENYFPYNVSHSEDNRLPLRYSGLLYGNIEASVCANSGIFTGNDVIKMLLAGADAVQVVSTLYKNGLKYVETMIREINDWMQVKEYQTINDFKGKLSKKNSKDLFAYKRAQYIDILFRSSEIFEKYPLK